MMAAPVGRRELERYVGEDGRITFQDFDRGRAGQGQHAVVGLDESPAPETHR